MTIRRNPNRGNQVHRDAFVDQAVEEDTRASTVSFRPVSTTS